MFPAIKSEFLKLFTVRSTYVITLLSLVLVIFFAGFVEGYKLDAAALGNPSHSNIEITNAVSNISIFLAIIAILLFSHEYRYNTIMYTLTNTNRRTKVLLAKILVLTGFAVVFTAVMGIVAPIASNIGIQLAGHDLAPQVLSLGDVAWRALYTGWAYAMIGLLLVALVRNQVFAIVALFFIPTTIEPLLGILLKHNAVYMPFTALSAVTMKNPDISFAKAAIVSGVYLFVAWLIAWFLFVRRDAN